jgi:hypothetical protein
LKSIDECYLVLVGVSWKTAESNIAEDFIAKWDKLNKQLGFLSDHTDESLKKHISKIKRQTLIEKQALGLKKVRKIKREVSKNT